VPVLEFLGTIAAAAVGALVGGATRLFGQRWLDSRKHSQPDARSIEPSQTLLIAGPRSLTRKDVVLTPEVRDMLRLPSGYIPAASRPTLLTVPSLDLAQSQLVTPQDFIGHATDELITKLDYPVMCTICGKMSKTGAYLDSRWVCVHCFYPYIKALPSGDDRLFDNLRPLTGLPTLASYSSETTVQILQFKGNEASEFIRRLGVDLRSLGIDLRRFGIDA
jgi:hypothetical protein